MENLKLDDFTRYTFVSGVKLSPDGSFACFVVHKADLEENGYSSTLWLYDTGTGKIFQLTAFAEEKGFIWLDDSEHILFPGVRNPGDKKRQKEGEEFTIFYKINIRGGEAGEAFRIPMAAKSIRQLDEKRFVFAAVHNPRRLPLDSFSADKREEELKRRKAEKAWEVVEEIPFWSNGEGFVSMNRRRLWLYDSETGHKEPLTDESLHVEGFKFDRERKQAVIVGRSWQGKREISNSLYLLDITKKAVRQLTAPERFSYSDAHFVTPGQVICRGNAMDRHGLNQNAGIYLVDTGSGRRTPLTPEFDVSTVNSVNSDCRYGSVETTRVDHSYLYFVTTEGADSFINRIDVRGRIEKLTSREGSVDCFTVRDGRVLFVGMRDLRLQELYSLEDGDEQKLSSFNDWVHEEKKLAALEPLSIEADSGAVIDGWVMKPVDGHPDQKYPAILNIHGGPKTVYGTVFVHEMQYWASAGFYVFFCNPRGSDGKGNGFADIRGRYGTIDYDDIMAFTDAVLERYPGIDRERMGVTGGSYGGFMTNWIIGHTSRFRAAAAQRSICNWVSMGYTSDIGYFFEEDQMAATPWSDVDKVWEHSPLKYADRVKTPTLFIHSEEDYRCWVPEALQMFTALRYHGVESRLCLFRGENHELSRSGKPKNRIKRLEEITGWFEKYLKVPEA